MLDSNQTPLKIQNDKISFIFLIYIKASMHSIAVFYIPIFEVFFLLMRYILLTILYELVNQKQNTYIIKKQSQLIELSYFVNRNVDIFKTKNIQGLCR